MTWNTALFDGHHHHHYHHHHLSLNREGRWGTTDDFETSFLHLSLFSTALWDFANSDRKCPVFVVAYGHNVFSPESEFPENLLIIECQYQTDGLCPPKKIRFTLSVRVS